MEDRLIELSAGEVRALEMQVLILVLMEDRLIELRQTIKDLQSLMS